MNKFNEIIGYSLVKKELMQIADTLVNSEVYEKLGVKMPKGLLLHGVPGVGKTLMANAVIEASGRKAFLCRKNKPNGDFVKDIKATFEKAVENAPSIVFLDDMDKFANGDRRRPDTEEYVTIQACIDEVKGEDVFVIATVNNMDCLPRSLYRAGRFDRIIKVENPYGEDAGKIIAYYLRNKKVAEEIEIETIAHIMDGKSCAELETIINEAGLRAGYEREEFIQMKHFLSAYVSHYYLTPVPTEQDKEDIHAKHDQVVCHEAGHAVVGEVLYPGSVALVCAITDQRHIYGFVDYSYERKKVMQLQEQSEAMRALGGAAAFEQKYGSWDSGSCNDIDNAFVQVRNLVTNKCCYGFQLYEYEDESSDLRREQEKVIAAEVERLYKKAKEIIALNREFFERVESELAQKGILTSADMKKIKSECTIVPVAVC